MRDVIRQKLADAVGSTQAVTTRREIRLPAVPGKTHAVIGMRRAGKTCYLHQLQRVTLYLDHVERASASVESPQSLPRGLGFHRGI